jgi:hypothetical protein
MLSGTVLVAALVLGVESGEPAVGSVPGPWAVADLGLSAVAPPPSATFLGPSAIVSGTLLLEGGVGLQVGNVRLSPTARFSAGPALSIPGGAGFIWSSLALALAAPDLINEQHLTGLRLTPVFGVTVPTHPGAFTGEAALTTLWVATQFERRFGPVELAYRLEGSRSFVADGCDPFRGCYFPEWVLSNRLFAEAWLLPSFSIALSLSWVVPWFAIPPIALPAGCARGTVCDPNVFLARSGTAAASVRVTWAFAPHFGATFDVGGAYIPPLPSGGFAPVASFSLGLSLWFRTDPSLARNWLDH